jgi:hypothetical protein
MSMAEKLACEWEARHDVAARHRIADVAPVQHYLTHVRCEDGRHPSASTEHRAARAAAAARAGTVPPGLRGWLRWGEDGQDSGSPIIPRC